MTTELIEPFLMLKKFFNKEYEVEDFTIDFHQACEEFGVIERMEKFDATLAEIFDNEFDYYMLMYEGDYADPLFPTPEDFRMAMIKQYNTLRPRIDEYRKQCEKEYFELL